MTKPGAIFVLGRSSFVLHPAPPTGVLHYDRSHPHGPGGAGGEPATGGPIHRKEERGAAGDRRCARSAGRDRAGGERPGHRGGPRQGAERGAARPAAAEREAAGRARRRHAPRRHAARSGRRGIRRPRAAQRHAAVQAAHPHRRHRRDLRGAAERHHRHRHALPQDRQRGDPARGQRDVAQQPGADAGHPGRAGRSPASRRPRCRRSPTPTGRW